MVKAKTLVFVYVYENDVDTTTGELRQNKDEEIGFRKSSG